MTSWPFIVQQEVTENLPILREYIAHSEKWREDSRGIRQLEATIALGKPPTAGYAQQDWERNKGETNSEIEKRYNADFPRVMRYSFIIMGYSLLESSLMRIAACMAMHDKTLTGLWVNAQAKKSNTLERFEHFWSLAPQRPALKEHFEYAKKVEGLRNMLAHRNGRFVTRTTAKREGEEYQPQEQNGIEDRQKKADDKVAELMSMQAHRDDIRRCPPPLLLTATGSHVPADDVDTVHLETRFCVDCIKRLESFLTTVVDSAGCFDDS